MSPLEIDSPPSLFELRTFDDPALQAICEPVKDGEDVSEIIAAMRRAMKAKMGCGLAACQIGVLKRIVLVHVEVLINPVITSASPTRTLEKEGCLSYPGVWAPVERALTVDVAYTTWRGARVKSRFAYFDARIVQHEIDHLDGICRVGDFWRAGRCSQEVA
jgi:peptide deformylase